MPAPVVTMVGELAPRLRLAVMRLSRRLRQEAEGTLTWPLFSALARIAHHGPLTLGDLAAAEGVRPPSMTRIVAALEQAGTVARSTDADDRRVVWVSATTEGRRLVQRSKERMSAFLAERLRGLSSQEREDLERACALLERIAEEER